MRSDAEKAGDDRAALQQAFDRVLSALTEGGLTFPPPFDFATSLALAANIDCGELAEQLFAVTAARDTHFRIEIQACSPEHPGLSRPVLNTTVASTRLLAVLLESLLDELYAKAQEH